MMLKMYRRLFWDFFRSYRKLNKDKDEVFSAFLIFSTIHAMIFISLFLICSIVFNSSIINSNRSAFILLFFILGPILTLLLRVKFEEWKKEFIRKEKIDYRNKLNSIIFVYLFTTCLVLLSLYFSNTLSK
jgi:hypothetical protein